MNNNNYIQSSFSKEDKLFEIPLRPQQLTDFVGQKNIIERLRIVIGAAKNRQEALGHCLFCGPPGLGKTTLAHILANAMGTKLITTSGPVLEKPADLAGILTNLQEGDILFIDEIHRLSKTVEEYLYPAIEDFKLDLLIDSGPNARSVQINLNSFTLVGATTRSGLLSSPMRSRFVFTGRLDYYGTSPLKQIINRSAQLLNMDIDEEACHAIAQRGRGTPRISNNLLKWVRDWTQMNNVQKVNKNATEKALKMLCIDDKGLDEMDKKILTVIIDHYDGGPVGLQTLGVAVGEEATTLAEVYEPFLIMQGFLKRTLRGREATNLAYKHMGRTRSE